MKTTLVALIFLTGVVTLLLLAFGRLRWRSAKKELRTKLEATRRPVEVSAGSTGSLELLPPPVQRYLQAVLVPGQKAVTALDIEQTGTINLSETAEQWKAFTASQRVVTRRPGFGWNARIAMIPGMPVFVQDAYVGGEGILRVALFGLFTKANLRDRGELARGELMRFLAEAPWYPTMLLPGHGVTWSPVDEHSAHATLQDGDLSVTLLFHFDSENLIDTVRAEARGRSVGAGAVSMPWQCRLWNYATRDGMRVPLEGEAAWITPEGTKTYWRGEITGLCYEFSC
jgi:hypothetical protein